MNNSAKLKNTFNNKQILITGGLGFIGSNLAIRLVQLGAKITLIDAMIPEYGGNIYNIESIKDKVTVNFADVRDVHIMNYIVRDKDYIFHLASQVSHVKSLTDPYPDIDINIKGTAVLLEACKKNNTNAVIIRAGTRGQYGNAKLLPVNEEAPTNPKGIYEISLLTAEKMMQVYSDIHKLKCVMLRLTNIYGPRSQMKSPDFGVVNWFIRLALDKQTIKVFGNGKIKRDFLYIDDCVDAMLLTASNKKCYGEIFNVGHDKPSNFLELTKIICSIVKGSSWEYAPFSKERKAQEPGDFYSDITKINSYTGWKPHSGLQDGLQNTIKYYKQHRSKYWK
ncbi:MAG TPA: GDP-mannose 4,6-dehydratase [Ignavibacteria bacterium]|nr:GDP-mannose 4,6-dehydratase [Ignavibacteria bacterium]